jgi:hypothetical protein
MAQADISSWLPPGFVKKWLYTLDVNDSRRQVWIMTFLAFAIAVGVLALAEPNFDV